MRSIIYLLVTMVSLVPTTALCSEIIVSLESKFSESAVVAVITVDTVTLGSIVKEKGHFRRTQRVKIKAEVHEKIYGKVGDTIRFTCHSVTYTEGGAMHFATVGFTAYGIKKGNKYIAYLTKVDKKYYLAGWSNQYLEKIDAKKGTVTDIGRTLKTVPLKEKLAKLRELAKTRSSKDEKTGKRPN